MLRDSQARALNEIFIDDIPYIKHPDAAYQELKFSAEPNRIFNEWDLPLGYSSFVDRYRALHFQHPFMAYRDALNDVKYGKVVILKPRHKVIGKVSDVTNNLGQPLSSLPLSLLSHLESIIARKLSRPVNVRAINPAQHAQAAETINSKMAGRLLAAGGIYNGNIEGFKKTAEQLGGDAPSGYKQVMDNKGLLITGASLAAGLSMGRVPFPELEDLSHFGARGVASTREFDPAKAGGPIENLSTDGVTINHEGIAIVEKHISRFGYDPANEVMVGRLKRIANDEILPEKVDLNYYTHECREYERYCNLGWETGEPDGVDGYDLWNNAHTATLEDFKLKDGDLYHPDALK